MFDIEPGVSPDEAVDFDLDHGLERLQNDNVVGFFKRNVVSISVDNQSHTNPYYIYPHSLVEVQTMQSEVGLSLEAGEWLTLAQNVNEALNLELTIVVGERENTSDYLRSPLNVGIGLIRVFWIMCFGPHYSKLLLPAASNTSFFKRETYGVHSCRAFVSAASYDDYLASSFQTIESQKREIGRDLFHRLRTRTEKGDGPEATWILSPRNIVRLASFLHRQRATDWRQHQARVVPDVYRLTA